MHTGLARTRARALHATPSTLIATMSGATPRWPASSTQGMVDGHVPDNCRRCGTYVGGALPRAVGRLRRKGTTLAARSHAAPSAPDWAPLDAALTLALARHSVCTVARVARGERCMRRIGERRASLEILERQVA